MTRSSRIAHIRHCLRAAPDAHGADPVKDLRECDTYEREIRHSGGEATYVGRAVCAVSAVACAYRKVRREARPAGTGGLRTVPRLLQDTPASVSVCGDIVSEARGGGRAPRACVLGPQTRIRGIGDFYLTGIRGHFSSTSKENDVRTLLPTEYFVVFE